MSELTKVIKDHLSKRVQNNELENEDITDIIDLLGGYLNLETYTDYSKRTNLDYNSVKARVKSGKIKEYTLFNVKFVIDNQ